MDIKVYAESGLSDLFRPQSRERVNLKQQEFRVITQASVIISANADFKFNLSGSSGATNSQGGALAIVLRGTRYSLTETVNIVRTHIRSLDAALMTFQPISVMHSASDLPPGDYTALLDFVPDEDPPETLTLRQFTVTVFSEPLPEDHILKQ